MNRLSGNESLRGVSNMKMIIRIASISFISLFIFALSACGKLPDPPTSSEVLQDIEHLTANTFIGETEGSSENILFNTVVIEDVEMSWNDETNEALITAFIGDKDWKSEDKHMIQVQYDLNNAGQWQAKGVKMNNPVIRVIPRE